MSAPTGLTADQKRIIKSASALTASGLGGLSPVQVAGAASVLLRPTPVSSTIAPSMATMKPTSAAILLPEGSSDEARKAFLWYLAGSAANDRTAHSDVTTICTFLATVSHLLYGDTIVPSAAEGVARVTLSNDQVQLLVDSYNAQQNSVDPPSDDELAIMKACSDSMSSLNLPRGSRLPPGVIRPDMESIAWYGWYGVLILAITKEITATVGDALKSNRFRNLRNKYKWTDEEVPILSDILRPTNLVFGALTKAWVRMPALKAAIFRHASTMHNANLAPTDEAFYLVIRLMRYSEMAHITLINEFLGYYPWAVQITALQSSVKNYLLAIRQLEEACPVIYQPNGQPARSTDGHIMRDTSSLPFFKLIYSDRQNIAQRSTMLPLLYVAKQALLTVNPMVANYTIEKSYDVVWGEFSKIKTAVDAAAAHVEEAVEEPTTS